MGIPDEIAQNIHTEQELEDIIHDINRFAEEENSLPPSIHISDENYLSDIDKNSSLSEHQQDSTFTPFTPSPLLPPLDPYLNDLSQPVPEGTHIFAHQTLGHQSTACVVCGEFTSEAHACPICKRYIHVICGRTGEEEGYGSPVWCPQCDIKSNSKEADITRAGIKRNQERLHERMVESSSKKFVFNVNNSAKKCANALKIGTYANSWM